MTVAVHFRTAFGAPVLVESSHAIPLVELTWTLRNGSERDPNDKAGLTRFWARMLRAGTSRMKSREVEERIASLGARFGSSVTASFTRFSLVVIERNLEPALALVSELFFEPAFHASEIAQVRRETLADLTSLLDNDRSLVERQFRAALFGTHPYGRPSVGTRTTIRKIQRDDLLRTQRSAWRSDNLVIGASGAVDPERLEALLNRYFSAVKSRGPSSAAQVRRPAQHGVPRKQHDHVEVWLVDKPERSQSQILIGTLGTTIYDPQVVPFQVANTVFGGTFTSRLMREVRSVRGWSYGASSRLELDRERDAWAMVTFPAAKDAVDCIRLQLELYETWWKRGITSDELSFAKDFLMNSYAFDIDTPSKRLHQRLDVELYGLPDDFYSGYLDRVRQTTLKDTLQVVQSRLSPRNLVIVIVATRGDVEAGLRALEGVRKFHMVPFQKVF